MRWLELVVIVVVLCLIGLLFRIHYSKEVKRRQEFAIDYRNHFIQYTNVEGGDRKAVNWLHRHSNRMQTESGILGVLESYRPAFGDKSIPNYPVFLNMIGQIEKYLLMAKGSTSFSNQINEVIRIVDQTLLNYMGVLDELSDANRRYLANPVGWFGDGVRFIVRLPIAIPKWLGIVSDTRYEGIIANPYAKFIGFFVSVFGLFGTIVTVVTGWNQFLTDIHHI